MTIKAKVGSTTYNDERARLDGAVIITAPLLADQGEYPVGLIMTEGSGGWLAYQEISDEVLGTGDGAETTFTGTLAAGLPVDPGSVAVGDGVEALADDGCGRLWGDAGGSGFVNYQTGEFTLTFAAAPANAADVVADYATRVDGVLDQDVDTGSVGAALIVATGPVRQDVCKVGPTAQAAPDAALLRRLRERMIFAQ
jgi:hypothetical protein